MLFFDFHYAVVTPTMHRAISLSSTDLTNYPCSLIHTLWANQIHEFYIFSDVKTCDTTALSRIESKRLMRSKEEDGNRGDCQRNAH